MNIADNVINLGLPRKSFIVVGSGIMAQLNIRESSDIDLTVSSEVFEMLKGQGWKEEDGVDQRVLRHGVFDVGKHWSGIPVDELLKSPTNINGVPFLSLSDLRKWKIEHARAKDLQDIALIDKYLESHP